MAMYKNILEHFDAYQETYSAHIDNHVNLMHELLDQNKTVMNEAADSGFEIFDHAMKLVSPLTIFSPDIMKDTLQKATDIFYKKLESNPDEINAIGLNHFEKQQKLYVETLSKIMGDRSEIVVDAPLNDRRFQNNLWDDVPYFSFIKQHYLLFSELVYQIVDQLEDLDTQTAAKMKFYAKQLVESLSPTNFITTNPDVLNETLRTKGENLKRGLKNLRKDLKKGSLRMTDMKAFSVGDTIAASKGHVIFENDILQLIRYEPLRKKVHAHPLLIIPAWINKYYLFDLTQDKSFVRWCLENGIDVYIVSWINPDKNHRNKTFCDYALEGLYKAVRAVLTTSKTDKINALGNCAGGILLNCLMAYLESHKIPSPFASATTLASPIDSDRLGDLKAFICDVQLKMLDESLEDFGIVPAPVLSQSFNLLRPKDLVWSFYVKHYLMGKKPEAFDILFWNCDSVNLPGRMHSQYLRHIFLDNKLIKKGDMRLAGTPIDLRTITTPSFILGAIKDHIVPWESVYPLAQMVSSPVKEFVLVGSGHVSGIVNHPKAKKYQYWTQKNLHTSSKEWFQNTQKTEGSWWPYWLKWVQPYLGGMIYPEKTEFVIENAPGRYVLRKHDDVVIGISQNDC